LRTDETGLNTSNTKFRIKQKYQKIPEVKNNLEKAAFNITIMNAWHIIGRIQGFTRQMHQGVNYCWNIKVERKI